MDNESIFQAPENDPVVLFLHSPRVIAELKRQCVYIKNRDCRYEIGFCKNSAPKKPMISHRNPPFEKNEAHIYALNDKNLCWYSVSHLRGETVLKSNLRGWAEANRIFGRVPMETPNYINAYVSSRIKVLSFDFIGSDKDYMRDRSLDEMYSYFGRVQYDEHLLNVYIVLARKGKYSWKLECVFRAKSEQLSPQDGIFAGMFFGSFKPLV